MEIVFLYDSLIRPDKVKKIIGKSDIYYKPCFASLMLYKFNSFNVAFRNVRNKRNKNFLTFGTLYLLDSEDVDKLDIYYGDDFFKKSRTEIYAIEFSNIKDFLNQKFTIIDNYMAVCYLGNLENERISRRYRDRRYRCGNFNKEFLQTYN